MVVDMRALLEQERKRRLQQTATASAVHKDVPLLQKSALEQARCNMDAASVGAGAIQGLCYLPGFLNHAEFTAVQRCIDAAPDRWTAGRERRMQNWGGRPGDAMIIEDLPPFISALVDKMVAAGVYAPDNAPNHCLVNDYQPGGGIQAHRDGLLYSPRVATLTLGGPALMAFHRALPDGSPGDLVTEVLLTEGCLFLTTGEAYSSCLHSIASRHLDVVTQSCCNARAAGAAIGDEVLRPARRISLVFVHKLAQHREP